MVVTEGSYLRRIENPRGDFVDSYSKEELGIKNGEISPNRREEEDNLPPDTTSQVQPLHIDNTQATTTGGEESASRFPPPIDDGTRIKACNLKNPNPRELQPPTTDVSDNEIRPYSTNSNSRKGIVSIESEDPIPNTDRT